MRARMLTPVEPEVEREFHSIVESIEAEYERLGHTLGWRFLYGPPETLGPDTRLALVGLNPGNGASLAWEPQAIASGEGGNAYRLERWSRDRRSHSALQVQVFHLYQAIAHRLGTATAEQLLDETLTAMFCPFRSANWDTLHRRDESLAFSRRLWLRVLTASRPRVIITFGGDARTNIAETLKALGARRRASRSRPTGWDPAQYRIEEHDTHGRRTLLVGLPHLSRFKIFGRPQAPGLADEVAAPIAEALGADVT